MPFWVFGIGPSAENVDKSRGECKTMRRGKGRFRTFLGSWLTISCQKESPCFGIFPPMFPCAFCICPRYVHHVLAGVIHQFVSFRVFYYTYNTTHNRQHTTDTIHNNRQHTIPTIHSRQQTAHTTHNTHALPATSNFRVVLDDS